MQFIDLKAQYRRRQAEIDGAMARVLEQPRFDAAADSLRIDAMVYANLMRWVVLDIPGVEVTFSFGDVEVTEPAEASERGVRPATENV